MPKKVLDLVLGRFQCIQKGEELVFDNDGGGTCIASSDMTLRGL